MRRSKQLLALIDSVIHREAHYIPNEGYHLDYNQLSDNDVEEITAQLIADDESCAAEATSPDNPAYTSKMLPALIRHLKNPSDKDEQIEFMNTWRTGVADYSRKAVEALLENRLEVHAFYAAHEGAA